MATNRIERLQIETLQGQRFFQDLLSREVYFDDFDDRSGNYFRLGFDPSFVLHGGKNLISIRGNSDTMEVNSQILIEAIDSQGDIVKTQVYDLNDDAHNRVISIDVTPETPPGELILTIMGVASRAPDGSSIPATWQGMVNFRWTRQFTAQPFSPNSSKIIYNKFSKPVIEINEIKRPFYELGYNQELSASLGWPVTNTSENQNKTSSYTLSTSVNTLAQVSYRKAADRFYMSLSQVGNLIDFGGFTKDMEGGIVIVRTPQNPRPSSINGFNAPPVYAETEQGDGLFENTYFTNNKDSYVTGSYLTTITEVLSPFEARLNTPHTTWQGTTAAQFQEFEHYEFGPSNFELIWSETPVSYSASPTGSGGLPLNTSYAHVTFNNLAPLTGDVTRVKCYMKNHQAPFDWVIASDNAIGPQELLYRRDFQKYRAPIGDFSQWGVAHDGIASLTTYWTASGIGVPTPSMSLYKQSEAGHNPPVEDNVMVGDNDQALNLDGTGYWLFNAKESASFFQDQWYELSFKAVSVKTQLPGWVSLASPPIQEPKLTIYMSGSAFTDGGDDHGKFIGLVEDTAVRKKHISLDPQDEFKEKGYKFLFKADGTENGLPKFKIDSGVWHFWDISIMPWDRQGYTPGTWDVIFPTVKCNVGKYDSLDFKFEFYNDYGMISNYTAVVPKVPWQNELTATFTNVVTNTISGSSGSFGNITTNGPNIFNSSSTFTGPATFSSGVTMSGPVVMGGPITMSGPGLIGQSCTDSWIISGSVYIPCLPEASQSKLVNWDPITGQLKVTSSHAFFGGGGGSDLTIKEEGSALATAAASLNFVGSSVTATGTGADKTITISDNAYATVWKLEAPLGGTTTDITHGETVTFDGGANITTSRANNVITIASNTGGGLQDIFQKVAVAGQTSVVADATNDTLTFVAGSNMTLTTNAGSDSITFNSSGGGGGSSCCSECIGDGHSVKNMSAGFTLCNMHPHKEDLHSCPITLGHSVPHQHDPDMLAGHYNSYAEPTWLQVNNWTDAVTDKKSSVGYAAIFNTTGMPIPMGDGCCNDQQWNRAGHGIKVATSTVPINTEYKDKNGVSYYSCNVGTWIPPMLQDGNNSGLPNAYYASFFHTDFKCTGGQAFMLGSAIQYYAGGIRKDCNNHKHAVIYETTSDKRLKDEIVATKWGIKDLMKLRMRDFHYKTTPKDKRGEKKLGMIAQEVAEIFPQAVGGQPDGDMYASPMTIAPDEFVPLLIKSVQDQQRTIELLERRINDMENK